jgi:hypothetical protein
MVLHPSEYAFQVFGCETAPHLNDVEYESDAHNEVDEEARIVQKEA